MHFKMYFTFLFLFLSESGTWVPNQGTSHWRSSHYADTHVRKEKYTFKGLVKLKKHLHDLNDSHENTKMPS